MPEMPSPAPATTSSPALTMPRRVAMQLLAAAQQCADAPVERLVVGDGDPQRIVVPASADLETSLAALPAQTRPWAWFSYRADRPTMPSAGQFEVRPQLLRLTASLATKGVLQLRAWALDAGRVVERELSITD